MSANSITLDNNNRHQLAEWLEQDAWIVACLCAAWCDTCRGYRSGFDQLSEQHPDKRFLWIDIEDQADFIGDIDVENFPTLLIQRGSKVAFFGTVLPDLKIADRLIQAQAESGGGEPRAEWQQTCNLLTLLKA
ncbi:thioredoxin family protein [Noviherbaspirillum denitrificans]|uniref:Thioredoxin n=1 Tax=Noviherbaspirillum denitrificans TaxID=1968433 RepID=A0A254TDH3_9BURK|nr:thioredoxin family protein [Noviherbaspirillum denitrificans]OWW20700.1 thioredoxin [Noviherbaspirillum denitrificans]